MTKQDIMALYADLSISLNAAIEAAEECRDGRVGRHLEPLEDALMTTNPGAPLIDSVVAWRALEAVAERQGQKLSRLLEKKRVADDADDELQSTRVALDYVRELSKQAKEAAAAVEAMHSTDRQYPRRIGVIEVADPDFKKICFQAKEFNLSGQLRETFRWLDECKAYDLESGKTNQEIEDHLRSADLIDERTENWKPRSMFGKAMTNLKPALRSGEYTCNKWRYWIG